MQQNNNIRSIVIICPYLFELQRGIERYCLSLADAFIENGITVTIYTWKSYENKACGHINPKLKIRKVPNRRYCQDYVASIFYRIWLRIDNPDITILNFMYHGEEWLPKHLPYLYVLHSPASQIQQRYEYARHILPKFSNLRIIAISKHVADTAKPYIGNKPVSLIYNGTDIHKFHPSVQEKRNNNTFRIITAAAFEPRKGIHIIIDALKDIKSSINIEYHIYGGGNKDYADTLIQSIRKNRLENVVKIMGSIDNLEEVMPTYDLFALPSIGEAFALSPIEAMACGLPILVSDCPPYTEFVNEDFGLMVNRDSSIDIQKAIISLASDHDRLQLMGINARKKAEEYSWDNTVKSYLDAITQTII